MSLYVGEGVKMKKIILYFFIIQLLFTSSVFAEIINKIYMKDGSIYKGKIVGRYENNLKLEKKDGDIIILNINDIIDMQKIEIPLISDKNPSDAFFLSFIPPLFLPIQGGGQIYNKQIGKGLLFYVSGFIGLGSIYYGYVNKYNDNNLSTRKKK